MRLTQDTIQVGLCIILAIILKFNFNIQLPPENSSFQVNYTFIYTDFAYGMKG